jgi:Tfp pilus assembly protein PilV
MSTQPFGTPQQFGGQMAELPPLANRDQLGNYSPAEKKQRLVMWLVILAAVIIPALIIGLVFLTKNSNDNTKQKQQQAAAQITYNADAIKQLSAGTATDAQVAKLDKNATFYTVLKAAAKQQIVNTKWDVYYTGAQDAKRGDQYTLYDTTIDYANKSYSYGENSYSNLGVFQTRCIGDKQYNFNDSKLTSAPTWQAASDSTDCALSTVTMHLNDGLNTGGLDDKQADAFMSKLQQSGVMKVNSVALTTNKDKQYLKVDANVVPQKQGNGDIYWGVQRFMSAFQATGMDATKHPYTFFGSSGEGAHVVYYVDMATQLPVYSAIESTPSYDKFGKAQVTTSWSHRFIEYAFPAEVTAQNINDHTPITFTAWPDH